MSMHVQSQQYICPKCSVELIPFKEEFKCPKCGEPIKEFFDFIPKLVDVMKYHKENFGSFMPPGWYSGNLTDRVSKVIFKIFDAFEEETSGDPKKFIVDFLNGVNWSGDDYVHKQIEEIALEVSDCLNPAQVA